MARGTPLPDDDSVTRACLQRNAPNGQATAASFEQSNPEKAAAVFRISTNWVQCLHVNAASRTVEGSIQRLKAIPLTVDYAAVLPVDLVRSINVRGNTLDVIEENGCHCTIGEYTGTEVDLELQEELADIANRQGLIKPA